MGATKGRVQRGRHSLSDPVSPASLLELHDIPCCLPALQIENRTIGNLMMTELSLAAKTTRTELLLLCLCRINSCHCMQRSEIRPEMGLDLVPAGKGSNAPIQQTDRLHLENERYGKVNALIYRSSRAHAIPPCPEVVCKSLQMH